MFTTVRPPEDEIRRTLPKLRRLLFVFFVLSIASLVAQLSMLEASDNSASAKRKSEDKDGSLPSVPHDDGSSLGAAVGGPLVAGANSTDLPLPGRGRIKPRKGDQHFMGLVLALFGISLSTHEPQLRRRLLTFACFTFLNFARSVVLLLQKVEIPPGARHLLSFHCPVPASDIAGFVRQQQHHFRRRLESGLPSHEQLLPPWEEDWPVNLPPDATVDLCSPSWALSNAYLIISGVCVLWMHTYALQMLRSSPSLIPDDGGYTEGLLGTAGRVVLLQPGGAGLHGGDGATLPGPGEQQHRPFVPFTGPPRKLDF
mmetsp:Transcript_62056/g.181350  ORF Transcript_62056/g.181350 Transcript_62056/m.181350 type:complete len:313 (-) Transcript_62056:65-1003(-)